MIHGKSKPDSQTAKTGITNFMGGVSYDINPMDTLKMITASSVFGEPQYYRDGDHSRATILDGTYGRVIISTFA